MRPAATRAALFLCLLTPVVAACPASASADTGGATAPEGGGVAYGQPIVKHRHRVRRTHRAPRPAPKPKPAATPAPAPGAPATLVNGVATAPAGAPDAVVAAIAAGNQLQDKPYRYGGGHESFQDTAYDCSGTVSFALHGAGVLASPLDSSSFETWGAAGAGAWITIYTNPGHMYAYIAGLRLDTGGPGGGIGPRWHTEARSNDGFIARHPAGL